MPERLTVEVELGEFDSLAAEFPVPDGEELRARLLGLVRILNEFEFTSEPLDDAISDASVDLQDILYGEENTYKAYYRARLWFAFSCAGFDLENKAVFQYALSTFGDFKDWFINGDSYVAERVYAAWFAVSYLLEGIHHHSEDDIRRVIYHLNASASSDLSKLN